MGTGSEARGTDGTIPVDGRRGTSGVVAAAASSKTGARRVGEVKTPAHEMTKKDTVAARAPQRVQALVGRAQSTQNTDVRRRRIWNAKALPTCKGSSSQIACTRTGGTARLLTLKGALEVRLVQDMEEDMREAPAEVEAMWAVELILWKGTHILPVAASYLLMCPSRRQQRENSTVIVWPPSPRASAR